uniref:NADH dehydrogenase subunit 4L n=1 Tax=Cladotaenia vulturi TaxID=1917734 RepID=A0A1J0I300_9CEST|nr:NADH dehydrogenase subunit 4L [Cladotaenia vulturi]APC62893.1 NADH dehydrogenase subunit 4L [Cladotaenia vulturi]
MVTIFMIFFCVILMSFFLLFDRFLNCLIVLENFNVLILLFCLYSSVFDSHVIFVSLMVISTVEVIIGLIVLTHVWECSGWLELVGF